MSPFPETRAIVRMGVKAASFPFGVVRRRRPEDVVILLYHRVRNGIEEIDLPPELFERQMSEIRALGPVISLAEAIGGRGGIVISVDDGYRDFYDAVLPVLSQYRLPAILYLATSLVDNGNAATRPLQERLNWDHLREAVATGLVTVGSHTHTHADLSNANAIEAEHEMRRSKELIEDHLGVSCTHFAYPWGVASPAAEQVAARLFDSAALPAWKTNRGGRFDRHALGRIPVLRSDGMLFFRGKARGMLNAEAAVYRILRRGPWERSERASGGGSIGS
jgi:peptidoglycan/xylan/chitin deacetylase (PgdA/CDA1 family)